ncbi:MAG TPA: DNA replication/repair protein RecF [Anaerolineae bacterium]|nr:DNA replication/repair protein RecF [Anaerolineae bacterium]
MHLKQLTLTHFRNYARLELDLPARISVFSGGNAQGKTNLLEAIYYLATTRSPLASSDRQLINWAADREAIPYARLEALFAREGQDHTIEMTLVKGPQSDGDAVSKTFRRQIRLDGVLRGAFDAVGTLNVVLFLPEDISLVAGSPAERRRYLDITLCQIDRVYCRSLSRYNRVVRQRNALLRQICASHADPNQLDYWDEQLSNLGSYVLSRRLWATHELARHAVKIHLALTGGQERLQLRYHGSVTGQVPCPASGLSDEEEMWASENDAMHVSGLAASFLTALRAARAEEIARAVTVLGPHRDDLRFLVNDRDATIFASRGQQRTLVLALKLAEVELMRGQTGEMPILLLDDVISELDEHRAHFLLQSLAHTQQVLITTTNEDCFTADFLASAVLWRIHDGSILRLDQPTPTGG